MVDAQAELQMRYLLSRQEDPSEGEPDRGSIDEVGIEMPHQYRPREERKGISDGPSGVDLRHVKYWCRREGGLHYPSRRRNSQAHHLYASPAWRTFVDGETSLLLQVSIEHIFDCNGLTRSLSSSRSLLREDVKPQTTYPYECRMHAAGSCIHLDRVSDQLAMFLQLVRFSNADQLPRSSPLPLSAGACQWLSAPVQE